MNTLKDWLTLHHVTGIGPATFHALLEHFGSPSSVLNCDEAMLNDIGLNPAQVQAIRHPDQRKIEQDLAWLAQSPEHHILTLHDENYPPLLTQNPASAPPVLYVKGNVALLSSPQIAMVGSRNPSPSGKNNAFQFAQALAQARLIVTSGLALGVDGISHQGALAGQGQTLAVCATGLDSVYPARHRLLAEEILEEQGALISEHPIGTPAKKEHFPRRNRIISGLSLGTLVVEAALRSGSLITARYALEQNREVFAIPGALQNPLARGTHSLIKQGAKLVENIDDILEELRLSSLEAKSKPQIFQETLIKPINLTSDQLAVFAEVGFEPTATDAVIQQSGLTADRVSSILMELELQRYITSTPGGYYARER